MSMAGDLMYTVQKHDQVHELDDVPFPDPTAPNPLVLADGATLVIAYRSAPSTGHADAGCRQSNATCLVVFRDCFAIHFGLPNEHAFATHSLPDRGLRPYGAFEVENSSWIRGLEERNRGHPRHDPQLFDRLRHWVWTFHDTVLECAASSYLAEEVDPEADLVLRMRTLLVAGER
jgi:hypothetical protein